MDLEREPVIGIVGGMGPQAGGVLFNEILRLTAAHSDQQHLSSILMSFPRHIPDRTFFLEGGTSINPAYSIARVIQKLEAAGADVVGIACNTSHSPMIYEVLSEELEKMNSRVRMVNMPWETCKYIRENHPKVRRVGIMTTNGTYGSGLYQKLLQSWAYEAIVPEPVFQNEIIHKMMYDREFGLKANADRVREEVILLAEEALRYFMDRRADAIILGCTELSLVLQEGRTKKMQIIDSTRSLARALIREATSKNNTRCIPFNSL